jgi:hypothetical protein
MPSNLEKVIWISRNYKKFYKKYKHYVKIFDELSSKEVKTEEDISLITDIRIVLLRYSEDLELLKKDVIAARAELCRK